jgi:hypothetical protein
VEHDSQLLSVPGAFFHKRFLIWITSLQVRIGNPLTHQLFFFTFYSVLQFPQFFFKRDSLLAVAHRVRNLTHI